MPKIKKKDYRITGGEFEVIIDSLCVKAESAHFSGQANGELKNRYERLCDTLGAQFNHQLGGAEAEGTALYKLSLDILEKRRLARALRYVQMNQKYILEKEMCHEVKAFQKARARLPVEAEFSHLQDAERARSERFSTMAGHILMRLGYLNPEYSSHIFGLAYHRA